MAKTLEKETVSAIELAILTAQKAGRPADVHAIAGTFNCTYQSVCYIRRRLEKHRETGIDDRKKPGRKPLADQERMAESIRNLLAKRPELDQSAISDYLYDDFGVRVCQATISRLLKKNGIPHKISNKLYKKSKLFRTDGEPKARRVEDPREVAASALSELPSTAPINPYKSPYPLTEVASVMAFTEQRSADGNGLEDCHTAASKNMDSLGLQEPATNLVNYMTPYG
jgi:transposase